MINPLGTIYSGMSWTQGIIPAAQGITLPSGVEFNGTQILEITIPNEVPPLAQNGVYTFAIAVFEAGSANLISNIATDHFEIKE